ncbi:hypothetical protein BKCO1_1000504 [Neofusicoccum parvum]|nr:hypothetical protein BKCO1_1000504 [Neofusicoccum parvum]
MPVVVQDSQAQMPTRGVFRWDGDELTWELSLKKIDAFVNMRAKNKREAEEKSGASSLENTVIDSTSTAKESIARIPSVQAGMPSPPKTALREPAKAAPRHPPYPDASLVAISELTPDSRANALVAHLAQSFYKTSGVDLIADGGSRRKIMLYAVRNEHPLRGKKRTQVIEMNFWAGQDLEWDLKGFELDALRDEWIKRFPEPEDSENEQDEEKDGSGDSDDGNTSEDSEQESIHTTRNSPVGSPSPTGSKRNHSAIISSGENASSDDEGPDHDAEMEPASKKARLSGSPLTVASSCGSPEYTTPAPELPNLPTSSELSPTSSTRALSSRHSPAPSHESASRGVDMSIDSGASPKRGDEGVGAESETEAAITAAINFLDP